MIGVVCAPIRDGVRASVVSLPSGAWKTVLDFLCQRFPHIESLEWQARFARGDVLTSSGLRLSAHAAYMPGARIHYFRDVADEPTIPFSEAILHHDDHLLVVDKPHFLPIAPRGRYVRETLLSRLLRRFDNPDISPLHRLDMDTAGVVMFSCNRASRAAYQALFRRREVRKEYEAIAPVLNQHAFPLTIRNRLVDAEHFMQVRATDGEANAETTIELLEVQGNFARYCLRPLTGRRHQLRAHMLSIGAPIVNDRIYPQLVGESEGCSRLFAHPLQLLAKRIEFVDPITQQPRGFASPRVLAWPS